MENSWMGPILLMRPPRSKKICDLELKGYIHLYTSIYIYIHLYTSIYIYIHLYTSIYIYIHLYTSIYIYIHLYTSIYIYIHLYTSIYIYIQYSWGALNRMLVSMVWFEFKFKTQQTIDVGLLLDFRHPILGGPYPSYSVWSSSGKTGLKCCCL